MFSRSSSYVLSASKAELKKSGVRYTAQSKKNRIDVQLLKDFPGVGVRGQIVAVKPSAMSNKLYPYNGAVYMNHAGAEPAIPVVSKAAAAASLAALKATQAQSKKEKKVKLNPILKDEVEKAKKPEDTLLSLDDLLSIDLNTLTKEQEDLVFTKLPKKVIFVKKARENVLFSPLEKPYVVQQIESTVARYVRESDVIAKFFNNKNTTFSIHSESNEPLESISKLGNYYINVKLGDREETISIIVNTSNHK